MTKAIVLDIEGTTTPIDFVHKTLFPFAKERVGDFVSENADQIKEEISALEAESVADGSYSASFDKTSPESVARYLRYLIDVDRKSTPLKSIQGKIWQKGYESGELKSEVFPDIPPAFDRWKSQGKTIAIYSSGSILAQQLLFRYTDHGDLSPFISAYFDTNTGSKKKIESYRKIAGELNVQTNEVLFVSDSIDELNAAREAGIHTALSVREGNIAVAHQDTHRKIYNFDDL